MNSPIRLRILLCLALVAALGPVSQAAAQTCMGFTCTIVGTSGNDILTGTTGPDVICGLAGADTISGAGGDDTICGDAGPDTLNGDAGSDLLIGSTGNDALNGGNGSDSALWFSAVSADLSTGSAMEGSYTDTLTGIENLTGSDSADTLVGDSGNNVLNGQGEMIISLETTATTF